MADEEREEKLFSREEAEQLLPLLQDLLGGAVESKRRLEEIDRQFAQVQNRILLYGGIVPPYAELAPLRVEREALVSSLRTTLTEVEQHGCVVKDLDLGLVDFLSIVNDERVYLCWKLGESHIRYWHGIHEGFTGRKPLGGGDVTKPN